MKFPFQRPVNRPDLSLYGLDDETASESY